MSMKLDKMGWFVAVGLLGAMCGMGFKAPGDKVGTVDVSKVVTDSDYWKKQQETLRAAEASRQGVLDLIHSYPVMRPEDARRFKDLSVKPVPTAEEKTEEEKITQAAKDADSLYRALATKANPSAAEVTQIDDFARRKDSIGVLQQQWAQEFHDELSQTAERVRNEALTKVRETVGQLARDQGYSMVFSSEIAPYSANDLTDAATKLFNKAKT